MKKEIVQRLVVIVGSGCYVNQYRSQSRHVGRDIVYLENESYTFNKTGHHQHPHAGWWLGFLVFGMHCVKVLNIHGQCGRGDYILGNTDQDLGIVL